MVEDIFKSVKFNPDKFDEVMEFFNWPIENRITLIRPVRETNDSIDIDIDNHKKLPEYKDFKFYDPKHHTYQTDETGGIRICNTMERAIKEAGMIEEYFDVNSFGKAFDEGIAEMHEKKISKIINLDKIDPSIEDNTLNAIKFKMGIGTDDTFYKEIQSVKNSIKNAGIYTIRFNIFNNKITKDSLFEFGMVFASRIPFKVYNRRDLEDLVELENSQGTVKSYTRVALKLDFNYR